MIQDTGFSRKAIEKWLLIIGDRFLDIDNLSIADSL
jgi:hypothetical protein